MLVRGGLTVPELNQLRRLEDRFIQVCERLYIFGIPETIHHDDLHDGNVFTSGVIFDWGDASISHPFFGLRLVLWVLTRRLEIERDDPFIQELMDIYFGAWSDYGSLDFLLECWQLCRVVEHLVHAETWRRVTAHAPPSFFDDRDDPVSECLRDLLEALTQ